MSVNHKDLKIMQWNCRSITAPGRSIELDKTLDLKKTHIACISETWLKQSSKLMGFKGYIPRRIDRPGGRDAGGVLFLIKEDLKFNVIQITSVPNSIIEAQAIEISLARDSVKILHIYNPVTNINISHLDHLIQQMGRKFIMVGDFNGHHTIWDPSLPFRKINKCGKQLSKYIIEHRNLALITTPGLKTYTHTTHRGSNSSTLDLAICSNNLIHISETALMGDLGSDHTPVMITVRVKPDKKIRTRRPKWKLKDASWSHWKNQVPPQVIIPDTIEAEADNLSATITNTAERIFGKTKNTVKTKFSKPWWTAECAKAVARRRRAKKTMERRPNMTNIIDFRRTSAKARQTVKMAKKDSWRRFCKSLSAETPSKVVWNMIKKLNGKGASQDIPLKENNRRVEEDRRKADILAENLWRTIGREPGNITPEREEELQAAREEPDEENYNTRFTMKELQECLKDIPPDKATGDDEVHNSFLKNLPEHTLRELLGLINRSWRSGVVPSSWRHSLVIPILKSGKSPSDPNAYRPVSLISCISKVVEKMIARRLSWQLEKSNIFSDTQSGFRKGRSTEDLILKLEHEVRASLVNKQISLAVFFDLKQAFDNVNINLLLLKTARTGIKGRLLCWLEQFLKNRTFQYIVGDEKSDTRQAKRGLPQGSALSPLLFNIMMCDLPHPENVTVLDFADDIAFLVTAATIDLASPLIISAIGALEEWARSWDLNINPEKSKAMCFTKQRKALEHKPSLMINNSDIEWVLEFKYLGVTFDAPTLTWAPHIEEVKRDCVQRLNILRALSGSTWGADKDLMLTLYTAYIRPKITYGISAVASASVSKLDKLETIQNAAIRLAIGARNTSPRAALQAEANLPPLLEHIQEICCNTYFRMSSQTHPLLEELSNDTATRDKVWTSVTKPPFIKRCKTTLERWNIPEDTDVRQVLIPSLPPWEKTPIVLRPELSSNIEKGFSIEQIKAAALNTISTRYPLHLKIYTDGSKFAESTSAAMWIPSLGVAESWKLNLAVERSIMGAELFAINQSLHWLLLNQPLIQHLGVVILTDSRSGIQALESHRQKSCSFTTNQMLNLAHILKDSEVNLTIQWIPSHVGLMGNERADELVKSAHDLTLLTNAPLDPTEMKLKIKSTCRRRCQQRYDIDKLETHIGGIRSTLEHWPWSSFKSRRVETAMARLRIGHSRLKAHLFRFGLVNDPNCNTCAVPENTKHILEECYRSRQERRVLYQKMHALGIQRPSTKVLLGGGDYDIALQGEIMKAMEYFLTSSGSIDLI